MFCFALEDLEQHQTMTKDEASDLSTLRWVGTEFIYFLSIPWLDDLEEILVDPSHRNSSFAHRADLSMYGLTFGLLETVFRARVDPSSFLTPLHCHGDSCSCQAIRGDHLARAIVPRARELYGLKHTDNVAHRAHGAHVARTLAAAASALDDAIYAMNGSLIGGHDALFVCTLTVFLVSLSRCARAIWGRGSTDRAFTFLEDRTRLYGEY